MNGRNDQSTYYYANGRKVTLVPEPGVYAVRYARGAHSASTTLSSRARRFLREESRDENFLPRYGLQIYRTAPRVEADGNATVEEELDHLDKEQAVEYVAPAFRENRSTREPIFATNQFIVQFKPEWTEAQIRSYNEQYRVEIVGELLYVANGYLLQAPTSSGALSVVELANIYYESGNVIFSHPNFIRRMHKRAAATAPAVPRREVAPRTEFLNQQWHLDMARVPDAWNTTKGNSSIWIAITDDGIDTGHPEFEGKVVEQFDFESDVEDGTPKLSDENHGTACAGVAVAAGLRASGAAPDCSLIAVRTPSDLADSDYAEMFRWLVEKQADVVSCSWGPADGKGAFVLPDNIRAAIHFCVTDGRGGKGLPIFFAAGNGNEDLGNDGYAANPDVIAIAASTSRDRRAHYSDFGDEIWVCAPSSGSSNAGEKRIFTTDRHGEDGYNFGDTTMGDAEGDYTNDFGGTSSATPLVAGIVGLMLSANTSLTVAEVREILKQTAVKIDESNTDTVGRYVNGFSKWYGWGRVDAAAAVERASQLGDGGGGEEPTPVGTAPRITGPESVARGGDPPSFEIEPGSSDFYAVELAADDASLLNGDNDAQRTSANFFATWTTTPFLAHNPYQPSAEEWNALEVTERVFYRMWGTKSDSDWVEAVASTADEDVANAPSILITGAEGGEGGGGEEEPTPVGTAPRITGPESVARGGDPPSFEIEPGSSDFYAVELAADDASLLNGDNDAQRTSANFFATWTTTPFLAHNPYQPSAEEWNALEVTERVFYRMWGTKSDSDWVEAVASTADEDVANAPSVEITGTERVERHSKNAPSAKWSVKERSDPSASMNGHGLLPTILGPESYSRRADDGPRFAIDPGQNAWWGVEVATEARLLDGTKASERTEGTFYASYADTGLYGPDDPTTYTLAPVAWEALRGADYLYYRLVTASSNNRVWSDYQASIRDEAVADAPRIDLTDRVATHSDAADDEAKWRLD